MHIRKKSLRGSSGESFGNIQMMFHSKPEPVDFEATRTILHSKRNPKNLFLWGDFLDSLNPIDAMDWKLAGPFQRAFIVIRSPMLLFVTIFVPVVDYERYKHGWSKLLNCTQIITNPFILITAIHCMFFNLSPCLFLFSLYKIFHAAKFVSVYSSWYVDFNINYAKWSLLLSVPLALFIFIHARTDMPPPYHIVSGIL